MEQTSRYWKNASQPRAAMRALACFLLLLTTGCATHIQKQEQWLSCPLLPTDRAALVAYPEELASIDPAHEWGKEMLLGREFAKEGDWYRALTCFRKARFLLHFEKETRPEIEGRLAWSEALVYGLAGKWADVLTTWERYRNFFSISSPTIGEQWVILLYAAYTYESRNSDAETVLALLPPQDPVREKLQEWKRLSSLDPNNAHISKNDSIESLLAKEMKSPTTARVCSACLPGLGYWYVGQKQTACTSFLLNAAFLGAGIQLLQIHQPFLALITFSFEAGWYLGGITGSGLEAEQYNQRIKETVFTPYLRQQKAFPILQIGIGW